MFIIEDKDPAKNTSRETQMVYEKKVSVLLQKIKERICSTALQHSNA